MASSLPSLQGSRHLGFVDGAYKTFSRLRGQRDISRLNLAVLNLAVAIFPSCQESLNPTLRSFNYHKLICSSFLFFPNLTQFIQTKKLTIGLVFRLYSSLFFSCKLLQETDLVNFNVLITVSQETGSVITSNHSVFQLSKKFIFNNVKNLFLGGNATISIAIVLIRYYRAGTPGERQKFLSTERLLMLASQSGQLIVCCMGLTGWKAPCFIACLNLGINITNYARFLISDKT